MPAEKRTAIDFAEMMRASRSTRRHAGRRRRSTWPNCVEIDQADWQEAEALGYPDLDTYRDSLPGGPGGCPPVSTFTHTQGSEETHASSSTWRAPFEKYEQIMCQ